MLKKLIGIFIILSPFTSYFALSAWLRLPVILILVVTLFFLGKVLINKKLNVKALTIYKGDYFLLSLLGFIWISWFLGFKESRSLNHAIAYTFTFTFYYFILRAAFKNEELNSNFILIKFKISAIICCAIIIIDWVLINFFNIGIREHFVNLANNSANMLYYRKSFFLSVGGVAEEPGSMALLLNIIAPLGILKYKLENKFNKAIWLTMAYLAALFCLFSTAGMVNVVIALIALLLYHLLFAKRVTFKLSYLYILALGTVASLVFIAQNPILFSNILKEVSQKIFLSSRDISASARTETWHSAFSDWFKSPIFGNGPGYGVENYGSGYHSVYLTLLADVGVVAVLLFILFILTYSLQLLQLPKNIRYFTGVAFFATILHFAIVGDFYHAPFWILLILIRELNIENKNISV